jgi:N-acetylmuramic acid 6-phosphate etherase
MSATSQKRAEEFLKIAGQFKLGALVTESSHPVTANLSEVAKRDIAAALDLLFQVDGDVMQKYREFVESGRAVAIKETVRHALKNGGRIFFTGCGSTGRLSILLDSVWRDFWQQQQRRRGLAKAEEFESRTFSVMAGGDYALIKSVEGFEDFTAFGKKQIGDLGVSSKDVVFAITEGGETSFVIGTAWCGVEAGAKVYFVYNNPDDVLCQHVQRSREVIEDARIEKINLTTGPMAITGSTRMQATSIQLCVMLTVLEMVVRDLMKELDPGGPGALNSDSVPKLFLKRLVELSDNLRAPDFLSHLASLVELEENVYRSGHRNNYYADRFSIDVLTDTTERSPTYCTPPFRKFDDHTATESWAFLFIPEAETPHAWERLLKRRPQCVEWSEAEVRALVGEEKLARTLETIRKISRAELMRFRIGADGIQHRLPKSGDSLVMVLSGREGKQLAQHDGFVERELKSARVVGIKTGVLWFGKVPADCRDIISRANPDGISVSVPMPMDTFLLRAPTRVAVKLVLNALSTCTMVRLGRVMGNYMVWVVPGNLKLIDRATRYIEKLTGLDYERANHLLFEVIEYVEPRMKSDQAYPPVVGMAVMRARHKLTNEEAEQRLKANVE